MLVTTTWPGSIDDHLRPRWPPFSPLWVHYHYPDTQMALALYRDGAVVPVASCWDPAVDDADDVILGGHTWVAEDDSWQAQVLAAAGYPVVPA